MTTREWFRKLRAEQFNRSTTVGDYVGIVFATGYSDVPFTEEISTCGLMQYIDLIDNGIAKHTQASMEALERRRADHRRYVKV